MNKCRLNTLFHLNYITNRPSKFKNSWAQFVRYGIVGCFTNILGYIIYLTLSSFLHNPKAAISIFYPLGAIAGYFGNRKYSFAYQEKNIITITRYAIAYMLGYGINLTMLHVLSDRIGFDHKIVQALTIPFVATVLFIMLKYYVFPITENRRTI